MKSCGRRKTSACVLIAALVVLVQSPSTAQAPQKRGEIEFYAQRSTYVTNAAKAVLDDIAMQLQQSTSARLILIGDVADQQPPDPAAQKQQEANAQKRAENIKKYLVMEQRIDPTRIDVKTGKGKKNVVEIMWVE